MTSGHQKQQQHSHTPLQHVINGAGRIGFEKKTMNDDDKTKENNNTKVRKAYKHEREKNKKMKIRARNQPRVPR